MENIEIGIIGGSGLYQMEELENVRELEVDTPFGKPSDAFIIGELEGVTVAFLPRHGRGHKILPTELPFRANIYAMKMLGIEYILSVSAVGSLQEQYAPTDFFIVCEGESSTQINGIAGNIERRLKTEYNIRPSHVEGKDNANWVLVDYFDVIVHIFYPEARKFYEIEDLWSDAKITEYQNI